MRSSKARTSFREGVCVSAEVGCIYGSSSRSDLGRHGSVSIRRLLLSRRAARKENRSGCSSVTRQHLARLGVGGSGLLARVSEKSVVSVVEIQAGFVDLGADADFVAEFERLVLFRLVGGPGDESAAVRVSRAGEIDPIAGDGIAQLPVFWFPRKIPWKIPKDVGNLRAVERAQTRALRAGRPAREVVEI